MKEIQKISSFVLVGIIGITVILGILFYFGGSIPETAHTSMEEKNFTSVNLIWAVILFTAAVGTTLIFTFINLFKNPQVAKNFLIIFILGILLILISYITASSEPLKHINLDRLPSEIIIKWAGAGINAAIIMTSVAILTIVVSEIVQGIKSLD